MYTVQYVCYCTHDSLLPYEWAFWHQENQFLFNYQ